MIRHVLLRILEAVESTICMLEVLEVPDVIRCMLLCMLETVEGKLCLVGGVGGAGGLALCATLRAGGGGGCALLLKVFEVPEVMRCRLLCILEAVEGALCFVEVFGGVGGVRFDGGNTPGVALCSGGCGGYVLYAGGARGAGCDSLCATLYAGG